jgi:hypothetical protein
MITTRSDLATVRSFDLSRAPAGRVVKTSHRPAADQAVDGRKAGMYRASRGYPPKPRNIPSSSKALTNSRQSMLARFRLLSTLHSSEGDASEGRLFGRAQVHDHDRMIS